MDARLIFHPVRLRVLTAISGQQVTTKQLRMAIPEIPPATLYRHILALIRGGILEVVEQRKIRGVEERILRIKGPPSVTRQDLKGKSKSELEQMAFIFVSELLADMRRYLRGRKKVDPFRDGVQVSKVALYLSDAELAALNRRIVGLILAATKKTASVNRKGRIFSYTIVPSA